MKFLRLILVTVVMLSFANTVFAKEALSVKQDAFQQGYFPFYVDDKTGKVYVIVGDNLASPFLFQSSLPYGVGSNDIGLDRGQLGSTRLVKFERFGDKVFLKQLNTYYRANSENKLEVKAVEEAFASSILWSFKVVNTEDESLKGLTVIDYTPFLLSDIHNLGDRLKRTKQGSYSVDKSRSAVYPQRTKAFERNTELESIVTFKGSNAGKYLKSVTPDAKAVTVHLHHSLIKLPDDNYKPREFHPFSGFWSVEYADYATAIDEPLVQRVIPRHRLSKKSPNAKVSEAVEPIVYYLDPGVPEPVRSALIDGAMWWDQAFEAIGYKNAFQVKMLPADADPMDVNYNVIQWVHRATRGWSYGSSVIDPRTGEILKGHVTLGSLRVRQDYLIALGLTSPFVNKDTDTSAMKEMALARIRQLSAHEVGHTLGIAHNFAASVNNRASVMDYPHPLIELKGGKIDLSNAYATDIGEWDKFVVNYGYGDHTVNESESLNALVKETQAKGLQYISDPDARPQSGAHATAHLWDNGEVASQELLRVLEVRQTALKNFGENTIPEGTPLSEIEQALVPIYNFHRYQVEATAKLIAGIDYFYEVKGAEKPQGVEVVKAKEQQKALDALLLTLDANFLTLPSSLIKLIPPKAYGYYRDRESFKSNTGLTFDPITAAEASAKFTLGLMLNKERLARLAQQSAADMTIFSVDDVIKQTVLATMKRKPLKGHALLIQQRINQQVVEHLLGLWHHKDTVPEVRAAAYSALDNLVESLEKLSESRSYRALSAHYQVLAYEIEQSLESGKKVLPQREAKLPPGSPIGS